MKDLHKQSIEKQLDFLKDASQMELVLAYLPLVLGVRSHCEETPEALAAGVVGLLKARRLYSPTEERHYKFSAYATYFIKDAIERAGRFAGE